MVQERVMVLQGAFQLQVLTPDDVCVHSRAEQSILDFLPEALNSKLGPKPYCLRKSKRCARMP